MLFTIMYFVFILFGFVHSIPLDETFVIDITNSSLIEDIESISRNASKPVKLVRDEHIYNRTDVILNLATSYPFRSLYDNKHYTLRPLDFQFITGRFDWNSDSMTLSTLCMTAVYLDSECRLSYKCRFTTVRYYKNIKICLGFKRINAPDTTISTTMLYSIIHNTHGLNYLVNRDYIALYNSDTCCSLFPRRLFYGQVIFHIDGIDGDIVKIEYEDLEEALKHAPIKSSTQTIPFEISEKLAYKCDSEEKKLISHDGTVAHLWNVDNCNEYFFTLSGQSKCLRFPTYTAPCAHCHITKTTPILLLTKYNLKIGQDGLNF